MTVVLVAGCAGGTNDPKQTAKMNMSEANAPQIISNIFDANNYWNYIRYIKTSVGTYTKDPNFSIPIAISTGRFLNATYQGTYAREWFINAYPADLTQPEDSDLYFGVNTSMDLFFTPDVDDLRFLGGQGSMDFLFDPEMSYSGYISPRAFYGEMTGDFDLLKAGGVEMGVDMDGEPVNMMANWTPPPINPDIFNGWIFDSMPAGNQSIAGILNNHPGFNLEYQGLETLKIGRKYYDCYVLDCSCTDPEDNVYIRFWYAPAFPAMPLKYVLTGTKFPIVFKVEDLETASDKMTR